MVTHDVFISYSRRDKAVADAACAVLESYKIRCWIAPRDVQLGIPYAESLLNGIIRCRIFVLVFSAESNTSPQVMREVEIAVKRGIPIIPLRIENVTPSGAMEYYLSVPHWLDAYTPPLENHLKKLAITVLALLPAKPVEKPEAEPVLPPAEEPEAEPIPPPIEKPEAKSVPPPAEKPKAEPVLPPAEKPEAEPVSPRAEKPEAEPIPPAAEKPEAEPVPPPPEKVPKVKPWRKLRRVHVITGASIIVVIVLAVVFFTGGFGGRDEPEESSLPALTSNLTSTYTPTPSAAPSTTPTPTPTPTEPTTEAVIKLPTKEYITIGAVRPLTGPLSFLEEYAFGPVYKMWVEEVNARGGIYVEEYGKKLPLELIVYDDKSDMNMMKTLLKKLMEEDEVDFVLSPAGTEFLYAAAPVFNEHGYILLGMEGGSASIRERIPGLPYFFNLLNFSDHNQVPILAGLLKKWGVRTAAIIFVDDILGVDYSNITVPELEQRGIEVVSVRSVPSGVEDISSILQEAKAEDVDAFLAFTYPDTCILATTQSMEIGYNPDVFLLGPGGNFVFYKDLFGADVVEGVMACGAWNEATSPAAAEFHDKFLTYYDEGMLDYWGQLTYWSGLEVLEQAIEKAGTLDQAVIRDVIANEMFNTCLGLTWFENGLLAVECYPGQIGQWQNGVFEVIDPGMKRTAEPIYPKPRWPGQEYSRLLLWEDDFSNVSSGWPQESLKDSHAYVYENGEYYITEEIPVWMVWSKNTSAGQFTDFILEVDARLVSGPSGSSYGVTFRTKDYDNLYLFQVSENGFYQVYKLINDEWHELQKWTLSNYINQGHATNHLKVICRGSQIEVYVNDHHLFTVTDSTFTQGYMGLGVQAGDGTARAAFDNLRVYSVD